MRLTFYGTRGSCPVSGESSVLYGGNTSCVLVEVNGESLILDCGTGLVELGKDWKGRSGVKASIFLSHLHIDHIIGLPFFPHAFNKANRFTLYTESRTKATLDAQVLGLFRPPYFPLPLKNVFDFTFIEIFANEMIDVGNGVTVKTLRAKHPNKTTSFRVDGGGKSVTYLLDYELADDISNEKELIEFCANSDAVICDCCYSKEEITRRKGWGHSSFNGWLNVIKEANVNKAYLVHQSHLYSDAMIFEMAKEITAENPNAVIVKDREVFEV